MLETGGSTILSSYMLLQKNNSRAQDIHLTNSVRTSTELNPRLIEGSSLPGISKYPQAKLEDFNLERGTGLKKAINCLKYTVDKKRRESMVTPEPNILLENINNL